MNHKVLSHNDSFDIILNKLKAGNPFAFVRFGDGDHIIMYKQSLHTVVGGGNQFFVTEQLQREIIECYNMQDDNFLVGTMLNDHSSYQMAATETKIDYAELPKLIERKEMIAMSCLFETFINNLDKFIEFVKQLRKTSTMFVCNYNHENISKVYGDVKCFIEVPYMDCYSSIEEWYEDILDNIDNVDKVILSAGFSGRVVAKRLWQSGIRKIILDVGSLSDVFIFHTEIKNRINSRTFMNMIEGKLNNQTRVLLNQLD